MGILDINSPTMDAAETKFVPSSSVWSHHLTEEEPLFEISAMFADLEQRGRITFPNLRNCDCLIGALDISDGDDSSNYSVLGFLLADESTCREWDSKRKIIRSCMLPDGRRVQYKSFNDYFRRNSLASWLDAANQIDGLLAMFAIEKSIPSIFGEGLNPKHPKLREVIGTLPSDPERLLRQLCLSGLIIGGLSRPKQNLLIVFDEDDVFANKGLKQSALQAAKGLWSHYMEASPGKVIFASANEGRSDGVFEDFVSLPDLACGAIVDTASALRQELLSNPKGTTTLPQSNKQKTDYLCTWLCNNQCPLKKVVLIINPGTKPGRLNVGPLSLYRGGEALWLPGRPDWKGSIFGGEP